MIIAKNVSRLLSKIFVGIVKSFVGRDGFLKRVVVLLFLFPLQQLSSFQREVYQQWTVRYIHDAHDSHDPRESNSFDHFATRDRPFKKKMQFVRYTSSLIFEIFL